MQAVTYQYSVMESNVKIKISSEFIFEKILLAGILLFFLMEIVNTGQMDSSVSLLYLFVLFLFSSLLVMVSIRPGVYYDTENLYFKKFNQPGAWFRWRTLNRSAVFLSGWEEVTLLNI